MARIDTLGNFLTDVADAIREKKGTEETISAEDFDTEIENLPSSGGSHDWSAIGYSGEPETIANGYNYAKDIYDNWDSSVTSMPSSIRDTRGQIMFFPGVDMSNITNLLNALAYQQHLVEIGPITVSNKCNSLEKFCYYDNALKKVDFTNIDTSNIINFKEAFYNCSSLEILKNLKSKSVDKLQSTQGMFSGCSNFKSIDLSGWQNTDLLTNIHTMFSGCSSLESIKLNLKNVNNIYQMFSNCRKLIDIEFGNDFDGSSLTNMSNAFYNCWVLNNDTLNRILGLCINATNVSTKTLSSIGFDSSHQPTSVLETLPNYQAFLDAGWTIGY